MSTLRKRSDQPAWFMAWGLDHSRGSLFPLTLADSRDYFSYMSSKQHARSRYTGWLECAGFLHHILGVFIEDGYHTDPYVKGLIRQQLMDRPRRKQSRTFRVKEIIDLENFLEDKGNCSIDRYIVACVLFTIFSRSRFGDLHCIEKCIVHCNEAILGVQVGYMEVWSSSHIR